MILEMAQFKIVAGQEAAFEAGVRAALPLFQAAEGYRSLSLTRVIEAPNTYRLLVGWDKLEDHTETFRNSPAFAKWRELVGSYFDGAPQVDHVETVVDAG